MDVAPNYAEALCSSGSVLVTCGHLDEEDSAERRVLEIMPDYPEAHFMLAGLRTHSGEDDDVAAMDAQFAASSELNEQAIYCFALAKRCEDRGDYDRTFNYFERGSRIKRASIAYAVANNERDIERVIAAFTDDLLARHRGGGRRP